jgi:enterochelin esterase family protein
VTAPQQPVVGDAEIRFQIEDPDGRLAGVRLQQELQRPRDGPEFERRNGGFELRFPLHPVLRMEYLLALRAQDGSVTVGPDAAVPRTAPGAFGDKTDLRLPGYREPAWLGEQPAARGERIAMTVACERLGRALDVILWRGPGAGHDAPLLLVHDGPEFDRFARLGDLLDVLGGGGDLPPLRAALVAPVDRDEIYGANDLYAAALVDELLPAVAAGAQVVVGLGASLGALALLHAHVRRPGTFAGLLLQSGSFFHGRTDGHERWFAQFGRIEAFVGPVLTGRTAVEPVPIALTCGLGEENLACNRALAAALAGRGVPATLTTVADAHNWIAWRDALDPALPDLLRRVG